MTWFDVLVLLGVVVLVLFEAQQEAGRGLLDAVATVVAVHLGKVFAPALTEALHWKPLPGTEASPLAQGVCFVGFWIVGLLVSGFVHRQTRWSMDNFDLFFGVAFGLMIAIAVGHVTTDVTARTAIMKHGTLPAYMQNSFMADELRSFRSYHYVLDTFQNAQDGR
jgi:hypothetical protein